MAGSTYEQRVLDFSIGIWPDPRRTPERCTRRGAAILAETERTTLRPREESSEPSERGTLDTHLVSVLHTSLTPVPDESHQGTSPMSLFRFLLIGLGKILARPVRRHLRAFEAATHNPQDVQDALLKRILTHQTDTDFGRRHRFHEVRSLADFRNQIPIADYDYFEPYIECVRRGEINALLADRRVHMFALTSGTTAARKYIPVTDQYLADYKRGWNIWGLRAMRDHKNVRLRPIVQLSGDHEEFHTEAGIPCGAVTGLTAAMQKRIVHWLYCVPGCVGKIKDAHAKYYLTLRLSLPRKVGMVIAANPSTLVQLAKAGDAEKEAALVTCATAHCPGISTSRPKCVPSWPPTAPPSSRTSPRAGNDHPAAPGHCTPRITGRPKPCCWATGPEAASVRICVIIRVISARR